MANKPGVVLVHGAWHSPWHFENITSELERKGYTAEAPALPTVGLKVIESPMAKAIAAVKQAIYNVSIGRDVVLLMHSFGGVIGSEAVAEFEEEMRVNNTSSQHGHVVHLLFVAAIIVEKDTAWASQSKDPHATEIRDGMVHHLEPIERFYNNMEPALAQQCAARLLPQSLESLMTPTKHRGWADYSIPVTYIACERDMALRVDQAQLEFTTRIEYAGVRKFKVERIECDHTPWLNQNSSEFFRVLWDVLASTSSEIS